MMVAENFPVSCTHPSEKLANTKEWTEANKKSNHIKYVEGQHHPGWEQLGSQFS